MLAYHATFWDINCNLLQQGIIGIPVGLGLVHTKFVFCHISALTPPPILGWNLSHKESHDMQVYKIFKKENRKWF